MLLLARPVDRKASSITAVKAMKETWDALIQRAEYLAAKSEATEELLTFYAKLLGAQKGIYESLRSRKGWLPTGVL